MTDAVQQWWDLKSQYFDTVLLFKTGKMIEKKKKEKRQICVYMEGRLGQRLECWNQAYWMDFHRIGNRDHLLYVFFDDLTALRLFGILSLFPGGGREQSF